VRCPIELIALKEGIDVCFIEPSLSASCPKDRLFRAQPTRRACFSSSDLERDDPSPFRRVQRVPIAKVVGGPNLDFPLVGLDVDPFASRCRTLSRIDTLGNQIVRVRSWYGPLFNPVVVVGLLLLSEDRIVPFVVSLVVKPDSPLGWLFRRGRFGDGTAA